MLYLTEFLATTGTAISVMALASSYYQVRVKKYEVKRDYRNTIINWFSDTTKILIETRLLLTTSPEKYEAEKTCLLSKLSAQIEVGRLYFPNIDKGDNFGSDKPKAYQEYRNLTLDFLVYSFDIFQRKDANQYEEHLIRLQREYTSITCEIIDPEEFIDETKKHSDKFFSHKMDYKDFLDKDPKNSDLFFPSRPN